VKRYSLPLDAVPVASLLVQPDGTIAGASPAATRLLGDVVGQSITKLAPQVRWSALFQGAVGGDVFEDGIVATREGEQTSRLYVNQVDLEGTKFAWMVVIERADPKDPANQRLESLGLVAGGIAHDFNNLLVGVLAEASAAREEPALTEGTREALRRIEASARRMAQLTRQLLAFAGRAQFVTIPVDADELLSESRDSLTRSVRTELALTITAGAPRAVVEADPHLLRQVLANLVSNASDAAASRVDVNTRLISRDGMSYWQLEVADDGLGIDASALPRIFEPFFSTKSGHHGLGLSAVHGIVRRLGGDVEVDTRGAGPARGSRFRVRLPIALGVEPAPRSQELLVPSSRLTGMRALVADDEPSVRATVRRLLERRGATVVVAADGNEAEARLRDEQFSLVITDVAMPGATGWEVLSIARATQPGVRVVLMSGYTEKLRGTGSEDEPDAFLEKPFTAKGLDATVDEVLKGR
jgi:two-component system cell cycle sensor histidine kinase/response regulator CckA